MEKNQNKMGVDPIGKLLFNMSWPAILSMLINALYNIVDSIFVAMISEEALTAVSFAMPIQLLIISLAVGSGIGINSLISRSLGAGNIKDANNAATSSIIITLVNYSLFLIFGLFLAKSFINIYSDVPEVAGVGTTYLKIVTMFSCFLMFEIMFEKVLQSTGNMILPMIISLSGAITNLILDPILIFGLLGMPKLGVAGAALATIIGQGVGCLVAITIIFTKKHAVSITFKGYKFQWRIIKEIYRVGLPSIIMQSLLSVMLIGYNGILAAVSSTAVAVLGCYNKLQSFIFMPVFGICQGAMPIIGYNFGAKNKDRVMDAFKKSCLSALGVMLIGLLVFQTFPEQLLKLFSASDQMIDLGIPALRKISLCFIPAAFSITISSFFQGIGHGMYSLASSIIRQLVGILPIAYIMVTLFGVTNSWYSFPIAEVLGLTYSALMLKKVYKKEIIIL